MFKDKHVLQGFAAGGHTASAEREAAEHRAAWTDRIPAKPLPA